MPSNQHPFLKVPLGDLVSIASGKLNSADAVEAGAYPFFTCGKDILRIDRFEHDREAVLLGGNNANAIFPVFYYKGRFTARQRVYVIWSNSEERLNNQFLYYVIKLLSPTFTPEARGTTTLFITLPMLKGLQIPLPDIKTQKEIASTLKTIDDKIALLRETNATLEAFAQALFKSWFVDFDPVRAKAEGRDPEGIPPEVADLFPSEFEDSELGEIPKGWRVGSVGVIADVIDCLHAKKPELLPTGKPFLQLSNIRDDGLLDLADVSAISEADYTKWTSRIEVRQGDCVITNVGRVGAVSQIPPGFRGAMGRNMTAIRPKPDYPHPTYLVELLQSKWMRGEIERLTDIGTILNALNVKSIPQLRCALSPNAVLNAFEDFCRPLRASMEHNLRRSDALAGLRDTLLPRLMSGKLRIPEIQEAIEEATA